MLGLKILKGPIESATTLISVAMQFSIRHLIVNCHIVGRRKGLNSAHACVWSKLWQPYIESATTVTSGCNAV